MKGAFIGLLIGIVLLSVIFFKDSSYRSGASFDIHLHDTYFVLDEASSIFLACMFLGTFFSPGGLIGTYFRGKLFWTLTVITISIDTYFLEVLFGALIEKVIHIPRNTFIIPFTINPLVSRYSYILSH